MDAYLPSTTWKASRRRMKVQRPPGMFWKHAHNPCNSRLVITLHSKASPRPCITLHSKASPRPSSHPPLQAQPQTFQPPSTPRPAPDLPATLHSKASPRPPVRATHEAYATVTYASISHAYQPGSAAQIRHSAADI
eukprot:365351-Chlamydomonas_euryale.AAC.3